MLQMGEGHEGPVRLGAHQRQEKLTMTGGEAPWQLPHRGYRHLLARPIVLTIVYNVRVKGRSHGLRNTDQQGAGYHSTRGSHGSKAQDRRSDAFHGPG